MLADSAKVANYQPLITLDYAAVCGVHVADIGGAALPDEFQAINHTPLDSYLVPLHIICKLDTFHCQIAERFPHLVADLVDNMCYILVVVGALRANTTANRAATAYKQAFCGG